jgi:hypothetical protein
MTTSCTNKFTKLWNVLISLVWIHRQNISCHWLFTACWMLLVTLVWILPKQQYLEEKEKIYVHQYDFLQQPVTLNIYNISSRVTNTFMYPFQQFLYSCVWTCCHGICLFLGHDLVIGLHARIYWWGKNITTCNNSMEMSPSWETASSPATQEFPNIFWNPEVHYHIHKSPTLVPILKQINSVHTIPSYLPKIHCNT